MNVDDDNDISSGHDCLVDRQGLVGLITENFPLDNVVHAFAYGSGVFAQDDTNNKNANNDVSSINDDNTYDDKDKTSNMIDIIFVVDNARMWHEVNLRQNHHHYAWLPRFVLRSRGCAAVQNSIPAGIYYHIADIRSPIRINNNNNNNDNNNNNSVIIKYGVVEHSILCQDVREWTYLYLAGRLHKPTLCIDVTTNTNDNNKKEKYLQFQELQQKYNLPAAVATALLLLMNDNNDATKRQVPSQEQVVKISFPTLFETIASLSYTGDFRFDVGAEDVNKITKLVYGHDRTMSGDVSSSTLLTNNYQYQRWKDLYRDALRELETSGVANVDLSTDTLEYAHNSEVVRFRNNHDLLLTKLPTTLRQQLLQLTDTDNNVTVQSSLGLRWALRNIVAPAARTQALKGLLTTGIVQSSRYAIRKLQKGRQSTYVT